MHHKLCTSVLPSPDWTIREIMNLANNDDDGDAAAAAAGDDDDC